MSAGCVHHKASVGLAMGFMAGSLVFGPGWEYAIGSLVGILIGPDLDVDNGNISNQVIREKIGGRPNAKQKTLPWFIIRRRVAWAVEKVWDGLWYFYRRSVKHGSELSHFPVISTAGRLGYLYLFVLVLPYIALAMAIPGAWTVGDELAWWNSKLVLHYRVILGLMGSDFIHWGLDILTTEHKKQKKRMILGMPLASSTCR